MTDVTPSLSHSLLLQALEQLSALDGKIGVLQGQANLIIQEQERSTESRNAMYVIIAEVKRLTPLVDKHEIRHNEASGAMWLGKTLWAASAGAIGAIITILISWLTGKHL